MSISLDPSRAPGPDGVITYVHLLAMAFFSVPEVLITTIALTYSRLVFGYTLIGFFVGNFMIDMLVRLPLYRYLRWDRRFLADVAVVFLDMVLLKLISRHSLFQADEFENLKWRYALLAAILGNVVSFFAFRDLR